MTQKATAPNRLPLVRPLFFLTFVTALGCDCGGSTMRAHKAH